MEIFPQLAKAILLPPASLYILCIAGWILMWRHPILGRSLLALAGGLLISLSLPIVSHSLYDSLSNFPPLDMSRPVQANSAIVILGAEAAWADEYRGEIPGAHSFARLRYGARLNKRLNLPVLVSGGVSTKGRKPVAQLMAESLRDDFNVPVRWQENESQNTYENALFTVNILFKHDIKTVYLVTHATHMARAKSTFESLEVAVIPAPVGVPTADQKFSYGDFLPNSHALASSTNAVYEYFGRLWYLISGRFG